MSRLSSSEQSLSLHTCFYRVFLSQTHRMRDGHADFVKHTLMALLIFAHGYPVGYCRNSMHKCRARKSKQIEPILTGSRRDCREDGLRRLHVWRLPGRCAPYCTHILGVSSAYNALIDSKWCRYLSLILTWGIDNKAGSVGVTLNRGYSVACIVFLCLPALVSREFLTYQSCGQGDR